ncbi:MAG: SUMF1/EgtB/PvdO family nonheme iron enzyme [Candidatus Riflebacteria bacterium]|nr:SUMF1/EgtB/PvdO family nonheme iron enzyme [Candidatus Riflebacteria bacterium]
MTSMHGRAEFSGTFLARYELRELLGEGAMGSVFRARQRGLGRDVAIKFSRVTEPSLRERFLREGRLLASLRHPNVILCFDAGEEAGELYLVLELVEGTSLKSRLEREKLLPLGEVWAIARQVCAGLGYVHEQGVVHRDLKSDNVLLATDGTAKLADFGLGRNVGSRLTMLGTILGTPGYMAPELVRAEPCTASSDLYGLGAILYELLSGSLPFDASDFGSFVRAQQAGPPAPPSWLRPGLSPAVDRLVLQCLEAEPSARPSSALLVEAALRELEEGRVESRPAPIATRALDRDSSRRPAATGATRTGSSKRLVATVRASRPVVPVTPSSASPTAPTGGAAPAVKRPWPLALAAVFGLGAAVAISQGWFERAPSQPRVLAGAPAVPPASSRETTAASSGPASVDRASKPLAVESRPGGPATTEPWPGLTRIGPNSRGFEEFLNTRDDSVLVLIPGGSFEMGDNAGDSDERPVHRVTLTPYLLGRHEVTWVQFERFCAANRRAPPARPAGADDNHPFSEAAWKDAEAYASWAGLRLPTEAEWELGARGFDGRHYPWGNDAPGKDRANHAGEDGYPSLSPVGAFPAGASPFGCLDMAGNVWEYCQDWYSAVYPAGPVFDPRGPVRGAEHVKRGGGCGDAARYSRATFRAAWTPLNDYKPCGFRVARSAPSRGVARPLEPK